MALNQFARLVTAGTLTALFIVPQSILAQAVLQGKIDQAQAQAQTQSQTHVVSPSDLQRAAVDASRDRQKNLDTLNNFFSSDQARQTLQANHINPEQVKTAIAGLNPDELAQMASRVNHAQADFAAGNIDNHDMLLILLVVAVLILVIVAVDH